MIHKWKTSSAAMLLFSFALLFTLCGTVFGMAADDPFYDKQAYLQQIHMSEAWDIARENKDTVIAIVDTGVDLKHPDLQPNLVAGANLINPKLPPQDDNGHGTNVAGVIAAVGNNDRGVTGILWKAKIMPIKALEADGSGGEKMLGEGIRYAVDHGAKIVVLSLGLNKYSSYMSDIVRYAEERDVLLVAATGNEGNRVKYPAAYPTVLAVGGVGTDGTVDSRSNTGPEIDVVAPWDVFTTALGGSYENKDGTSMAAPQVAAAAALLWGLHPELKPYQIRQKIRQTAEDVGGRGWNPQTGYGLLRVDRLLKEPMLANMYEPNNRKAQAKTISISKKIAASFSGGTDQEWYAVDADYDGTLNVGLDLDPSLAVNVQHTDASGKLTSTTVQGGQTVPFQVTKGRNYLLLQLSDRNRRAETPYQLTTSFDIYKDPYEDNDKQYKAFVLPSRSQTIKGTFHQYNDVDWFELPIPESGSLGIRVTTDTARIDPVLLVQRRGEKAVTIDQGDDGAEEIYDLPKVFPGSYYIRISNVKDYANPVVGEYTLSIEYNAKLIDPNEPNNHWYQATAVSLDTPYNGLLDTSEDIDWFQFQVGEESLVNISLTDIPSSVTIYMALYDGSLKSIAGSMNSPPSTGQQLTGKFAPGTYYVKLTTGTPFDNQMYQFRVTAQPLLGGYTDIKGHWAQDAILSLSGRQLIDGYGNYTFQPDRPITRAEAAAVLTRAFKLTKQRSIAYSDLDSSHWGYSYIARAAQAGMIDGYPDGTVAPDQPVSRMEMTAMMARSLNMTGKKRGTVPFTDVDESYWGTGLLKQMKAEGWIAGYADGSFRPDQQATRAEFMKLLSQLLKPG
ncbi:S8 family serine peptidase [Paenibacillus filicis]|uniref:S8 family serine peptidase n=1 Tax=Paenibacillus gyeongsangnamensis TaxID=3388067 RepID=A0ABT4QDR0_9BACL|nr:S8 family serine peptidase [Paenibacillus filicis]MCZ8514840.1 S8 family serine peptidase [Paenibacillus filicis]